MGLLAQKRIAVATVDLGRYGLPDEDAQWLARTLGTATPPKTALDALSRTELPAANRRTLERLLSAVAHGPRSGGAQQAAAEGVTHGVNLVNLRCGHGLIGEPAAVQRVRSEMGRALWGHEALLERFVRLAKDHVSEARVHPALMALTGPPGHGKAQAIEGLRQTLLGAKAASITVDFSMLTDRDAAAIFDNDGPLTLEKLKKAAKAGLLIQIVGADNFLQRAPALCRKLQTLLLARRGEPSFVDAVWICNFDTTAGADPHHAVAQALGAAASVLTSTAAFGELDGKTMARYALSYLPKLLEAKSLKQVQLEFDDAALALMGEMLATPHAPLDELEQRLLRFVLTHCDTQTSLERSAGAALRISVAVDDAVQRKVVDILHAATADLEKGESVFSVSRVGRASDLEARGQLIATLRQAESQLAVAMAELSLFEFTAPRGCEGKQAESAAARVDALLLDALSGLSALQKILSTVLPKVERRHRLQLDTVFDAQASERLQEHIEASAGNLQRLAGIVTDAPEVRAALDTVRTLRSTLTTMELDAAGTPVPAAMSPQSTTSKPFAALDYAKGPTGFTGLGQSDVVAAVAVFPDGRIVMGFRDKTARIWNQDGTGVAILEGHTNTVGGVAVLPDGRIVTGSRDETARIWSPDGTCAAILAGHAGRVDAVAVLPDGRIVTGSGDNTARIWNPDGTCAAILTGHAGMVWAVAALPDGRIVTGSADYTAVIWNPDGSSAAILLGHTDEVWAVAVLPDGRIVTGSYDNTARIWNPDGTCVVLKGHTAAVSSVAVLPDGRIVTGSRDKNARIWNPDGSSAAILQGHTKQVWAVAVLPDGRVVTGSGDKTVRIWSFPKVSP